ncbi:MAG: ABC transporter ATP-binding protein [Phycisphaerae bacterium]|nr:ABC transporter ATP-binding protein [Phycisphaerae bacterium]
MSTDGTPVVEVIALTKVFKDFWRRDRVTAVSSLDLDVEAGEVFGLLGPNGSGKTTTIKIILGLLYPTRGRALVFGRLPTEVAVKNRIGYLPEESYLYPFLNARETLDYYARLFQYPRKERVRRIEMLLDMVGLAGVARRRVGEYSKGMARRIGLAQALINDPDLLILDEPTTGLDPLGTRQIKELIAGELRRRGKTVLLCSHLLADVEDVCDRVSILYGGQRRALGDITELLSREELTQITAEKLKPGTIDRVRDIVRQQEGKELLEVRAPSEKLETLFIRIVREAQQARVATSGVSEGTGVAAFLRGEGAERTGEALIEDLVSAGAKPEASGPETIVEERPPEEIKRTQVIEELVEATESKKKEEEEQAEAVETETVEPEADRGVIDGLMKGADQEDDRGA